MARESETSFVLFPSWIGDTGSISGCPVNCRYCFLKTEGKTPAKPHILAEPEGVIDRIGKFYLYHPEIPINFGSQTDIFSTGETKEYYYKLLELYGKSGCPNPVVLITKRSIPDDFIRLAENNPQRTIFYISYSGLNNTGLEPTVNENVQKNNFIKLKKAGLPAVHYWRPFFPQNSTEKEMRKILDFVSNYALCSVAVGLHLNQGILESVARFWPQLVDLPYDFRSTGEFWPEGVLDRLQTIISKEYPYYPVFLTNTPCSVSYALGGPDNQGCRFDPMCKKSNCPDKQRQLCDGDRVSPSAEIITKGLKKLGISPQRAQIEESSLVIEGSVEMEVLVYLRWLLHIPVVSSEVPNDKGYNWASASGNKSLGIIEVPWESGRIEI